MPNLGFFLFGLFARCGKVQGLRLGQQFLQRRTGHEDPFAKADRRYFPHFNHLVSKPSRNAQHLGGFVDR